MRIQDILVESQQLDEGPILNKIGTGIGKLAGGAAKAVGAVAGGIAGAGQAIKKGYQAGKQTVAGAGDDEEPAAGAAGGAPAKPGIGAAIKAGSQYAKNKLATGQKPSLGGAFSAGTNAVSQPAAGGTAAPAAGSSAPAAAGGGAPAAGGVQGGAPAGSMYAQVKANIDKLDKKGKQRILAALQKEVGTASAAKPAAAPGTAPAAQPAPAPTTMAKAPVSKTNTAKPGNLNAAAPAAGSNAGAGAFGQMAKDLTQKPEPQQQKVPPKKVATKPAVAPAAEPAAAPSGEKTIANPVATVGTKRASKVGQQTFDTQTGKALPGQSINAIRKKAEYGTGALGAARKRIKAGVAAPAESKTTTKPALAESFSLFRKK